MKISEELLQRKNELLNAKPGEWVERAPGMGEMCAIVDYTKSRIANNQAIGLVFSPAALGYISCHSDMELAEINDNLGKQAVLDALDKGDWYRERRGSVKIERARFHQDLGDCDQEGIERVGCARRDIPGAHRQCRRSLERGAGVIRERDA